MSYCQSKTIRGTFDEVVSRAKKAQKEQGFDVVTEIDIRDTLKNKIGVDFRPYRILGACNPGLAYEALQLEIGRDNSALQRYVQEIGPGHTEVAELIRSDPCRPR